MYNLGSGRLLAYAVSTLPAVRSVMTYTETNTLSRRLCAFRIFENHYTHHHIFLGPWELIAIVLPLS